MSDSDEQMIRELERVLDGALDEDSIPEILDASLVGAEREVEEFEAGALRRDSEALIGAAPSSEATKDSPTVEAYVGGPARIPLSARKAPATDDLQSGDLRPSNQHAQKRWNLDETPLIRVLLEVVTDPGPGVVEVRKGRRRAQLVIEEGHIFEIRLLPVSSKRSMTGFLQRAGKLTPEKAGQIHRRAKRNGTCEAKVLLKEPGLVSAGVMRSMVCSRTHYLLGRLLETPLSDAELYPLVDPSAAVMIVSLPLVGALFSQVQAAHSAKYSGRRSRARERFRHMQLSRKPCFAFSFNQLGLEIQERQLVDRVLGDERAFEDVIRYSPLAEDDTIAVLAALDGVGLLEVRRAGLSEGASSSWAQDHGAPNGRIELLEARLERENLFAIFGIHWTSYEADVVRGYREISCLFGTANERPSLSMDERDRVDQVRERLDAIYAQLIDSEQRELYRRKLIGATTRARAIQKLESLADAAVRKKALHSALDYCRRLVEIAPHHKRARELLPVLIARTTRRGR